MLALAFLLLAASPPQVVFDEDLLVPRSLARGIPVKVERPTYLHGSYKTQADTAQVRALLMTAADVQAFQAGRPHDTLAVTEYARAGEFRFLVMRSGEYFVVINNWVDAQSSQPVHVRVTAAEDPSLPRTLPAARRHAIVAISLVLFAMVAGWSGWRLRDAWLFR